MFEPAILVLADGSVFHGKSIGYQGHTIGEVVFNTAMTGYQEILTDPSYTSQIVTLTYPHIGNTGTNNEDEESNRVYASGLIIRDLPLLHSNFRSNSSLSDYLIQHKIVAIADIDTRRLTRILRDKGAQAGCIYVGTDETKALALAQSFGSMAGKDLAKEVTCKELYQWKEGEWKLGQGYIPQQKTEFHVVAYDFGVKRNILRMLAERGCRLTVVPATTSAEAVLALNPDGIFLSNGPGDPEPCEYAITAIKKLLATKKPIFGICLGHQLLGLATGGKTKKMAFGHHGANHPVQDLET
ncbi:glutamine-hydrolyzing carbamoyl-phosphate synthase small subunit, partial [Otariodibacter sp.]|uniref:glutamine-hydrolyzing carbamoyl-phosphate synthase small subunit n=1 Tax=Otariodibacter sp. TaxID=3030919 RepID=UPI002614C343